MGKETPDLEPSELSELYAGGLTLEETARQAGLGTRFAVAYRLEKAGIARRNAGSPRKTIEEKSAFARGQLERTFGESLPQVVANLQAGAVTAKELAAKRGVNYSTLRTQLKRAGVEVPRKGRGNRRSQEGLAIFDLVDTRDWPIAPLILRKLNRPDFSSKSIATATDEELKAQFGLTEEEILYLRKQLRNNGITS